MLQYAKRVWNISEGRDDEIINQAIDKTENFFNSLGINTKLSSYGIDEAGVDRVTANMEKMGLTALSETQDLGLDTVKRILKNAII